MSGKPDQNILRAIPKVDAFLAMAEQSGALADVPGVYRVEAIRQVLDELRARLLRGELSAVPENSELLKQTADRARANLRPSLRPVINATGVLLHTNLGRSILGEAVAEQALALATAYSTLEYNAEEGRRGSRHVHVENLLQRLTGCEAALAVNNNAAAMLLIMAALFSGREVLVSAGELVEIGGSFRIPEIMARGGAVLKAVGCTNKTRLSDYSRAAGPESGGLLKVHTSNFRVIGYTEQASTRQLAELARDLKLPLVCDLGSGCLVDLKPLGIAEPTVTEELEAGADLLCFSGDKLLGGPQAGIILGRRDLVETLKTHPLARALRVDKLTLAALEATLRLYVEPEKALAEIPTLAMLFASKTELRAKAETLLNCLKAAGPDLKLELVEVEGRVGGGAAPESPLPSWAVAVERPGLSENALEAHLRTRPVPIVARIEHARLLLDVRTVPETQFTAIAVALKTI